MESWGFFFDLGSVYYDLVKVVTVMEILFVVGCTDYKSKGNLAVNQVVNTYLNFHNL